MALDEKTIELINADIDGEIQPDEKALLEAALAASEEARAMHAELGALCSSLDAEKMLEPPPHLRHVVMNSIPHQQPVTKSPGFFKSLFDVPAFRYAGAFAAGVIMAVLIVDSGQMQDNALNEVGGLVGTISDVSDVAPGIDSATVNKKEVAGSVTLRRADPIMILDFDLSTMGPVDIVASYDDKTIWFNGFGQLEATGTSISADSGQIKVQIDGKRRYAVYLHNPDSRNLAINIQFFSKNEQIHEAVLTYEQD
jgi:hypothetical protein